MTKPEPKSDVSRRAALAGGAAALAATGTTSPALSQDKPKTFILMHGTWHGGWVWKDVRRILERAGHDVYAPSLTGCGDRAHLMAPDVGLDTHIQDITNIIDYESLEDVFLVGHSFTGVAITGAADRRRDKIRRVVFFDALVPAEGRMSGVSRTPDGEFPDYFKKRMEKFIDGYQMDFWEDYRLEMLVPESATEARAILTEKITPHPMRSWTDELILENGGWEGLPRNLHSLRWTRICHVQ